MKRRPGPSLARAPGLPSRLGAPELTVLLSGLSSDAHTWNLIYLQLLLEENGCRVNNLGACVPDDLLIDRALAEAADVLVLSSVNGHGGVDGLRLIRRLRACPELRRLPVVLGGKLGTTGPDAGAQEVLGRLRDAGFTAVFGEADDPRRLPEVLRSYAGPGVLAAAS